MGAHVVESKGIKGTVFGVWAPNARQVSVIGGFANDSKFRNRIKSRRADLREFGKGLFLALRRVLCTSSISTLLSTATGLKRLIRWGFSRRSRHAPLPSCGILTTGGMTRLFLRSEWQPYALAVAAGQQGSSHGWSGWRSAPVGHAHGQVARNTQGRRDRSHVGVPAPTAAAWPWRRASNLRRRGFICGGDRAKGAPQALFKTKPDQPAALSDECRGLACALAMAGSWPGSVPPNSGCSMWTPHARAP